MRRVIVTALCAASFLFMLPAPAHAWWNWLDELSGPGPFQGVDFQWRLACVQDNRVSTDDGATPDVGVNVLRQLGSFEDGAQKVAAGILGAGCVLQPKVNPISSLNFRVARLWSTDNHLQYASGVKAPTVNMWEFEPSFSTFVDDAKFVELTVGMGVSGT